LFWKLGKNEIKFVSLYREMWQLIKKYHKKYVYEI
jgi:hypothetical protein